MCRAKCVFRRPGRPALSLPRASPRLHASTAIMLRQNLRQPGRLRCYLTRVVGTPAMRTAHGWTPEVSSAPPNAGEPPLPFFTSHSLLGRMEANHIMTQNHDLYGQLVVSALLNPTLQAHWMSMGDDKPDFSEPERSSGSQDPDEISDQEWEIRTGSFSVKCTFHSYNSYTPTSRSLMLQPGLFGL